MLAGITNFLRNKNSSIKTDELQFKIQTLAVIQE